MSRQTTAYAAIIDFDIVIQDPAHRRHISAQRFIIGLSLIASHMVAQLVHISAHMEHILADMGDIRIMQLAHIWHISMQSMSMHIIFISFMPLFMHCIMVSMHIAMQLRQSSIHRRISGVISMPISIVVSPI